MGCYSCALLICSQESGLPVLAPRDGRKLLGLGGRHCLRRSKKKCIRRKKYYKKLPKGKRTNTCLEYKCLRWA